MGAINEQRHISNERLEQIAEGGTCITGEINHLSVCKECSGYLEQRQNSLRELSSSGGYRGYAHAGHPFA